MHVNRLHATLVVLALAAAAAAETPYRIQVGDDLAVRVFNRPELTLDVRVAPDGTISVIMLDEVEVAGLTTRELDDRLTSGYAEFFQDPQVTIVLRSFANRKVYVGGEVARPGPIQLVGQLSALTAVLEAGGFTQTARLDSVILLRDAGGDGPRVERLDLKQVIERGGTDPVLQPFDVLYVPMSRIAKVDKFVDQYIRQLLPVTLTGGFSYLIGERDLVIKGPE